MELKDIKWKISHLCAQENKTEGLTSWKFLIYFYIYILIYNYLFTYMLT